MFQIPKFSRLTKIAIAALLVVAGLPSSAFSAPQIDDGDVGRRQGRISDRYQQLEQKLLALVEFEKENNPARAKLLQKAFVLSQQQGTTDLLRQIVGQIQGDELKSAERDQAEVVNQLKALLRLLQSEDRGKRIKDELKRNREYLREVERLLRIQKSIRGQAEGGVDGARLAKSQKNAADQTQDLSEKMQSEQDSEDGGEEGAEEGAEGQPGEKGDPAGGQGKGQGGQPGPPGGQPSQSNPSDPSNTDQQPSPQQRIRAAEEQMRDAKRKLDEAKRNPSIEKMREAERELAKAKKELEEILRQFREEEVERTLAALEGRFRKMLQRELKLVDATKKLDVIPSNEREADFEINAGKLATEQTSISNEAARALSLLREDGTSVAFPQTIEDMIEDMNQVSNRLTLAKVGKLTVQIENDIVETLNYLVESLSQAQQDLEAQQSQGQQGQPGNPGESALINQLAEIRMLRALQQRIHKRHSRYGKLLDDPDDEIGATHDPEILAALERLANRQQQLTEITREIVEGVGQ